MILSTTARGFASVDFTDRYGVACSLQQSSLATEDAIWLGCNEPNPRRLWQAAQSLPLNAIAAQGARIIVAAELAEVAHVSH